MSLCSCNDPVKNFGQPGCVGILERPEKLAFIQTTADDGTVNSILSTDTINQAFVEGKINEADISKRWLPSPVLNKVNDTRGENNVFEIDGFSINVSQGVRTVVFTVIDGASPELSESFNALGCRDISYWSWSVTGQIGGNDRIADELRPIRIKKKTMQSIFQPPNKENETPAMILVQFAISDLEDDKNIAFIDAGTGANDVQVDISSFTGLIDVEMTIDPLVVTTTTTFTFDAAYIYGAVFDKEEFKGGVLADFTLVELLPTPAAAPMTSITEVSDGKYEAVITAPQTSGDTMQLSFSKTGFDQVAPLVFVIP